MLRIYSLSQFPCLKAWPLGISKRTKQGGEAITAKLIFKMEHNVFKVPESEDLYRKNLDYFKGMGIYDEGICHEKALLTTGYRIIEGKDQDF